MDASDESALFILHEVARRAGVNDEIVTNNNDSSPRNEWTARGESCEMSCKPSKRIVVCQAHHIQPITLRTSASDFFGVGGSSEEVDERRKSPVTIAVISPKGRAQLLHFIDPLVLMFNAADFDVLAAALTASCSKNVVMHTKLVPDGFAPAITSVKPFCPGSPPPAFLETRGVSLVLLFWMLMHEAHPDGVMQIIDKRICYRKVLPDRILTPRSQIASAASRLTLTEKACSPPEATQGASTCCDGKKNSICSNNCAGAGNNGNNSSNSSGSCVNVNANKSANIVIKNGPVSIVEVVLKISGACITTHSMHDLFCDLASGSVPELTANAHKKCGSVDGDQDVTFDTDALGRYISTCLTKETCGAACMAARAAESCCPASKKLKCDNCTITTAGSCDAPAQAPAPAQATPQPSSARSADFLHEHSRRYLLELRLVFDHNDVITDWTTTVIAAETF